MTALRQIPSAWTRLATPRLGAGLAVACAVLLLHWGLLGGLPGAPGPGWRALPQPAPTSVRVRQLQDRAVAAATTPSNPMPQPRRPAFSTGSAAGPSEPLGPTPVAISTAAAEPSLTSDSAEAQLLAPGVPVDAGRESVPTYATRWPTAQLLRYEWRRGQAMGVAELDWQPGPEHYRLQLRGRAPGVPPLAWVSQGGFDANGLAPLRYTESRRGREVRAANFQRDKARISFSGPPVEHPLMPGVQDRLSWMLQLAAVLEASPQLGSPDAVISMWVVGTRGDAEVWTFTVQGQPLLTLPAGESVRTLHLLREPRHAYDTQAQVWLDPARQHLPVRVQLRLRAGGDGMEMLLIAATGP